MRTSLSIAALACALAMLAGPAARVAHAANKVYRWVDKAGVVHYGDHAPIEPQAQGREVRIIPVRAEPGAMARLRVESEDGHYLAFADNLIAGPIEVMLSFDKANNIRGEPELPARATVPANGSVLVSRLQITGPGDSEFEVGLQATPGDPNARPQDIVYALPLPAASLHIDQGFGGRFSHTDEQNRYAIDFGVRQGTPVTAARAGVVMQVESDFDKAGLDLEKYGGRANYVRILHDDGTMGLYAHLKPEGVYVHVGQRVKAGQQIGVSGNTGFTTGPHLHFAVQVNRGMHLIAIPFRMAGVPMASAP